MGRYTPHASWYNDTETMFEIVSGELHLFQSIVVFLSTLHSNDKLLHWVAYGDVKQLYCMDATGQDLDSYINYYCCVEPTHTHNLVFPRSEKFRNFHE